MGESYYIIDKLTELNNETYLNLNYREYILNNPNSSFMMIDFRKFKEINDNFGHDIGDQYLIYFSRILKAVFFSSIVVRLHGDEFAIVTKFPLEEIKRRIDLCIYKIKLAVESELLPDTFKFNVGVVPAADDLKLTKEKADFMMYYAKKNDSYIQEFNEELWQEKIKQDDFLNDVLEDIKNDSFTYFQRHIHNMKNSKSVISEIATRDSRGNSIFNKNNYKLLRDNAHLKKVDIYNLDYLFTKVTSFINGMVLINLDYKSLLAKKDLIEYLNAMIEIHMINPNNVVLSINVNDMVPDFYSDIIELMNSLKKIGFKLCIDKYNNRTPDLIWENVSIDYIKLETEYWKEAIEKEKTFKLLFSKLKVFYEVSNIIPIFSCIKTEEEFKFIKEKFESITNEILVSGNYISDDNKIKIK